MKAGIPILLCGALAAITSGLHATEPGSMRARLLEELKREFKFEPPGERAEIPDAPTTAPHGVIVLPELSVTEARRNVALAVREDRERLERDEFSWRHGGTIKKLEKLPFKPTLMWKYNPEHNGIDLVNFSW
jgi:hypothetical protein